MLLILAAVSVILLCYYIIYFRCFRHACYAIADAMLLRHIAAAACRVDDKTDTRR